MTTPIPPGSSTLTDLYDRPRRMQIGRRRRRAAHLVGAMLVASALAACSLPAAEALPTRICGTLSEPPTRVPDDRCPATGQTRKGMPVRVYEADPRCLEPDDETKVGQPIDDDYLGEPCDPTRKPAVVVAPAQPTRWSAPTRSPSRASSSPAPRATTR